MAGGTYVVSVPMAGWELRVLGVIECRSRPGGRRVASLTGGREELGLRLVARVRGVVVIGLVAADARDRQSRVVAVHVTVSALARRHCVRTRQRECRVGVVEGGVGPDSCVVAQLARGRESRRSMGGIGRARIILLMARVAQRAVQGIIAVDVAIDALARRHSVRPGQSEAGAGVVEFAVGPKHRIVATLACRREMGRHVIHGRSGCVVVGLMATHAGGRGDVVIPVYVTIEALTRRHSVRSGQGKSGAGVVEFAVGPKHGVMATLARCGEVCGHVVHRAECRVVVGLMAAHASRSSDVVVVIHVTVRTLSRGHRMRSGQREAGGAVVESCIQPTGSAVALLAGLREIRRHVIRVRRALEILQVTRHAGGAGQVVVVVDVAIRAEAWRHGVRAGQNESGGGVIEVAIGPGHRVVALLAGCRESGMRYRCGRRVVVGLVATDAGGRGEVVVVIDVAIRAEARRHRVRTAQRETGGAVVEGCVQPTRSAVALFAGLREIRRHVIRVRRALEILQVTRHAGRAGQVVVVVDVAIRA